jgi:hypothetical protein
MKLKDFLFKEKSTRKLFQTVNDMKLKDFLFKENVLKW